MRARVWRCVGYGFGGASVRIVLFVGIMLLTFESFAQAQLYWDTNGATAGAGGSKPAGTWNGSNANWSTSSAGDVSTGAWSSGQTAVFSAGTDATGEFTVTVDGTQQIGGLHFEQGTVTLSGGALQFSSGATFKRDDSAGDTNINSTIQGNGTLALQGSGDYIRLNGKVSDLAAGTLAVLHESGKWVFDDPHTYTGDTTVTGGTIIPLVNSTGSASAGTLTAGPFGTGTLVLQSGTLRPASGSNITIGNAVTLDGDFTFGTTNSTRNIVFTGPISLTGERTLTFTSSISYFNGVISGGYGFTKAGASTLVLGAANTFTGDVTIDEGTLRVTASSGIADSSDVVVNGGATLEIVAGNWVYQGSISGAGGLTKSGTSGDLRLTGANTYTGATLATGGNILRAGSAQAFGSNSAMTITGDATVDLNRWSITLGSLSGSGVIRNGDTFYGSDPGGLTVLTVGSDNTSTEFSGLMADGAGDRALYVTKTGSGTLTLSGDNTYTGVTTINAGQLTVAHGNALGTAAGGVIVAGNATLALQGGITVADSITAIGKDASVGTIRNLSGDNTLSGDITKAGVMRMQSDAGTLTIAGNIGGTNNSITLSGGGDGQISGDVEIGWNFFKEGSGTWSIGGDIVQLDGIELAVKNGTLILAGSNTYTPPTNVDGGTLLVTGSTAADSAVTVDAGATLGGTGTIGGVTTIAGGATLAPGASVGTLTFGNDLTLEDGAVWDWEFVDNTAGNYDQVAGTTLVLPTEGATGITLDITGLTGHSVNWYDEFTLFTGDVENFDADLFTLVNHSDWSRGWSISAENGLVLTAVPEPGAWLLLLAAMACGLLVRRR